MLAGLECVDYVCIFSEPTPNIYLKKIKPNVHVKGGTFVEEKIKEEKELVESWGGKHVCLAEEEGYSSTNIINKIMERYNG